MPASSTVPAFSLWHAPESLVEQFASSHRVAQQETARMIRSTAAMAARLPEQQREFLAEDVAQLLNVHPRTAQALVATWVTACEVPGLVEAMESGEITDRHVSAAVEELGIWTGGDRELQGRIWQRVAERVRARLGAWDRWPTPGELRRRIRAAALLLDLSAAEQARKSVAEGRGVDCFPTAVGEGTLSLHGPDTQVVALQEAIRARAEAYGRLPGDTRTLDQRMFDAAYDLLMVDAAGGESAVSALDVEGHPVTVRVRGIEIQVLVPYSVVVGGDLELAEIPGYGPLLPAAARELLDQADHVRQVAIDAGTGEVLAVEDRLPVRRDDTTPAPVEEPTDQRPVAAESVVEEAVAADPVDGARTEVGGGTEADTTSRAARCQLDLDPLVAAVLERMLDRPVQHLGPLQTDRYRATARILRGIRMRDRTCCFPGCTTPARWTDADHREPWPRGATSTKNLHCLCRRHHRAKQAYFRVELDDRGHTVWITRDGRRYTRPPPRF